MRFPDIPLVNLAVCAILVPFLAFVAPGFRLIPVSLRWSGIVIIAVGGILIGTVFFQFRKNATPHDGGKALVVLRQGPFRFSRNPMYIGMTTGLVGLAVCFGSLTALAAPILFFIRMNYWFVPMEERKLEQEIGLEYREYKKKVRRWV